MGGVIFLLSLKGRLFTATKEISGKSAIVKGPSIGHPGWLPSGRNIQPSCHNNNISYLHSIPLPGVSPAYTFPKYVMISKVPGSWNSHTPLKVY